MKRIICTVTNDLTYDQRMIRICNTLVRGGYHVLLVGRTKPHSVPLKEALFEQKRLPCNFQKGKLFYIEYNIRLFFFLLWSPFDIVCSVDLDSILPGYFASQLKRKACVYDAHEYFTEVPEVVDRPAIKQVWEQVAQFSIPRIKYAYTVCESLARIFEERYGTAFAVIRNVPYRQSDIAENSQSNTPVLLYQGALNEGRGLEELLRAMPQLPNLQLWLAGEGDLSDELRQLHQELQLGDRVQFLGYIQPKMLKQVTLQASIGFNLLQNKGLSYYYSLANKAFDYIQAGVPSIHMDFPEYRILNEKYHVFHLVPDLHPQTLVAAIKLLASDKDYYNQLKANCLQARADLVWEKESLKLLEFYQNVQS